VPSFLQAISLVLNVSGVGIISQKSWLNTDKEKRVKVNMKMKYFIKMF
jgi:hypothetical protein